MGYVAYKISFIKRSDGSYIEHKEKVCERKSPPRGSFKLRTKLRRKRIR